MKKTKKTEPSEKLLYAVKQLIERARQSVSRYIDSSMTTTYFMIGYLIVENEQNGQIRAKYAEETLKFLSAELIKEFGKGFSERNLQQMRKFFLTYQTRINIEKIPQTTSAKSYQIIDNEQDRLISQTTSAKSHQVIDNEQDMMISQTSSAKSHQVIDNEQDELISQTTSAKLPQVDDNQYVTFVSQIVSPREEIPFRLSWSHYVMLCRIVNNDERSFYEIEAINSNWNIKELERQYDSSLYERLVLSRNKKKIKELAQKGQVIEKPEDLIKKPIVLEFLGLKEETDYTESDLEKSIINKIEDFLLELGKGFLFHGRQVRFTFQDEDYFVDLVFYNRLLKCFVIFDLKIGKLRHENIGQMQMYVRYYDKYVRTADENKTIGIIICKDKNDAMIEMTLPEDNNQIFASNYMLYLPSKEQLRRLIQ